MEAKNIPQTVITEMADLIDCGMVCYLNLDTMEMKYAPNSLDMRFTEWKYEDWQEVYDTVDGWNNTVTITAPEGHESFKYMVRFVDECITDRKLKASLLRAIDGRKPFAHFNAIVHNSSCREDWFAFKRKCLEEYVRDELS